MPDSKTSPKTYPVQAAWAKDTLVDANTYAAMYRRSVADPEAFWADMAEKHIKWHTKWHRVKNCDFTTAHIRWFEGAHLNVAENCIDRHLPEKADQPAIIWEPCDPRDPARTITYQQLHDEVCRLANAMHELGVRKGDRVCLYMPMVPEAAYAMLACARIGAIHSAVFAGFSAEALKDRIEDAGAKLVITADGGRRGDKVTPLKQVVDQAVQRLDPAIKTPRVLVLKSTNIAVAWDEARDVWWHDVVPRQAATFTPASMEANDPLFILYTSGSTGKPKGAVHGCGGYLLYVMLTHKMAFDIHPGDVWWCTADVGWVTGHSYIVYGPLANGTTSVMFEGVPTWPDPGRFWQVVARHKVTQLYTAPTAIRALMAQGDGWLKGHDRSSLRVLGSVGEPINPEAWEWYYHKVGEGRCPIIDTWWQTETGGCLINPLPGAIPLKPGSATKPFFGIEPVVVDDKGNVLEGEATGLLCIKNSWPGQMQTVYKNHQRFKDTYFTHFKGLYFSGDGCRRDKDGDYWITGRVDDVLNVSGHRMGTAEIESALALHAHVAEAAVVGFPHPVKGQGIYVYVTLNEGIAPSDTLKAEMISLVRAEIGPIATPDVVQWAEGLPKTRSGKIMRRILRKIAEGEVDSLGDTSTLAEPAVIEGLIKNRQDPHKK